MSPGLFQCVIGCSAERGENGDGSEISGERGESGDFLVSFMQMTWFLWRVGGTPAGDDGAFY